MFGPPHGPPGPPMFGPPPGPPGPPLFGPPHGPPPPGGEVLCCCQLY